MICRAELIYYIPLQNIEDRDEDQQSIRSLKKSEFKTLKLNAESELICFMDIGFNKTALMFKNKNNQLSFWEMNKLYLDVNKLNNTEAIDEQIQITKLGHRNIQADKESESKDKNAEKKIKRSKIKKILFIVNGKRSPIFDSSEEPFLNTDKLDNDLNLLMSEQNQMYTRTAVCIRENGDVEFYSEFN